MSCHPPVPVKPCPDNPSPRIWVWVCVYVCMYVCVYIHLGVKEKNPAQRKCTQCTARTTLVHGTAPCLRTLVEHHHIVHRQYIDSASPRCTVAVHWQYISTLVHISTSPHCIVHQQYNGGTSPPWCTLIHLHTLSYIGSTMAVHLHMGAVHWYTGSSMQEARQQYNSTSYIGSALVPPTAVQQHLLGFQGFRVLGF